MERPGACSSPLSTAHCRMTTGRRFSLRRSPGIFAALPFPKRVTTRLRLLFPELPLQAERLDLPPRVRPIFITGRFRSGSTLLWNLFRHIEGITSYYEPFNERRWFDEATRGERIDPTHRHVTEYWSEYVGLTELGTYYDDRWIDTELFMDESSWNPEMERFVSLLIDRAKGRAVLQFNHIDFRLQWFRRTFPTAYLVHIFRHPRDQWCSSLVDPQSFPRDGRMEDFAASDHFYLRRWARDLQYHFPFLDESAVRHPYQLFYYLWKLSYLFGRAYCHFSLAFERLVSEPTTELRRLFRTRLVLWERAWRTPLTLIEPPELREVIRGNYCEDGLWFREIEAECEEVMARFK